jgi:hypothetical protein
MGPHQIDTSIHQLAYVYGALTNELFNARPWLSIIDLNTGIQIAHAASQTGYTLDTTWFDYILGPHGEKYPFLAPGAHYLDPRHTSATKTYGSFPQWDYLCIFDPSYITKNDPACDAGFKHYSTSFEAARFRHAGGWVEDVDGDGWGDINLPYLQYILTISGKTGQLLGLSHLDVAARSEPKSPRFFHGGRFYGTFASFRDPPTGARYVLIADGEAVGRFVDPYCGVSRYFAVAQWQDYHLELKWSDYLSFAKTSFRPPYRSITKYSRLGDDLNKCVHRFGTSLEWLSGKPYVIFNLFTKADPRPDCQEELLAEQASHFDATASAPYEKVCVKQKVWLVPGHWSVEILDAQTGASVKHYPNLYVWGEAPSVVANQSNILLAQRMTSNGGEVRFDQTARLIDSFALVRLVSGPALTSVATLAAPPSPPQITPQISNIVGNYYGSYPPGVGSSFEGIAKLTLRDIDGDGLNDIELRNGQWIGWSSAEGKLVVKVAPSNQ